MTMLDTGTTGAKRQSWYEDNPREMLRKLVQGHPNWNRERLLREFKKILAESDSKHYYDVIVEYWFSNNYHSLIERSGSDRIRHDEQRDQLIKQTTESIKRKIEHQAKILLLDMIMPNGKQLRDCTGQECGNLSSRIGAWLLRISKRIKPTEKVGDVLSEDEIRAFYK